MASREVRDLERKIEALIMAIPREEEAYEFYMELHREYEEESSKDMFLFLANQERKHKDSLEELLAKLEMRLTELKQQT